MLDDTESTALCAQLEAIIKEAEDVEKQAAAARHRVQAARLLIGADGYRCPSARAIFTFIGIFLSRGLAARPHCLFDLRRHGRRRTSPSGGRTAQRPPAGEHRPRLFLHGTLSETVFCYQPTGFADPAHPDLVCRPHKSLYRLKQAPRAWYSRFATYLTTLGFIEGKSTPHYSSSVAA
jgi:hypothetical protein